LSRKRFCLSARLDQVRNVCVKGFGDSLKHSDCWIAPTAFNATQIGLMNLRAICEFLLREALLSPKTLKVERDPLPHTHAGRS
jgi:hypothetical protein